PEEQGGYGHFTDFVVHLLLSARVRDGNLALARSNRVGASSFVAELHRRRWNVQPTGRTTMMRSLSGRPTRRSNMKIGVIGGSGLIGKRRVTVLRRQGQEVLAASPASGVNSLTGEGLAQALAGTNVVVDVTNSPSWEDAAVRAFFDTSTRNLLAAERAA